MKSGASLPSFSCTAYFGAWAAPPGCSFRPSIAANPLGATKANERSAGTRVETAPDAQPNWSIESVWPGGVLLASWAGSIFSSMAESSFVAGSTRSSRSGPSWRSTRRVDPSALPPSAFAVWSVPPIWSSMTSGLAPVSRLSSTNIGEAVGAAVCPPKSTAPVGPSRKVSMLIVSGAGAVMYFFSGSTTVVIVLPSLVSRTAPASRSTLLGRTSVSLSGRTCRWALPPSVMATMNSPWSEYDVSAW